MAEISRTEPQKCLELNVKVLKVVGLWPFKEGNIGWKSTFSFYYPRITVLSASLMILSKAIDSIFIDSSLDQIIDHVFMSLMALMAILKNSSLLYRATDLERLITKIQNVNKSELLDDRKQLAIHNQHQRHSQILTKIYLTSVFLIAVTVSVAPLTKEGNHTLPHRMYLPYNQTASPYYELSYAWLSITAVSDGLFIGICDSLFISLLISVIGHYKVLQYKMANIREYAVKKVMEIEIDRNVSETHAPYDISVRHDLGEKEDFKLANKNRVQQFIGSSNDSSNIYQINTLKNHTVVKKYLCCHENAVRTEMENYVSNIVEHHRGIIRLYSLLVFGSMVAEIESVFGIVLLYQFAPSLFFLCNVAFKVARAPKFDAKLVSLLQLLLASITQLFLYCWYSTCLTDESTKLNEALYHCDWLKSSDKFKKSMRLIFLRANKPIHLNAAGFVHVSLELFRNVLRTSYSFYALLNQIDSQ